MRYLFLLIFFVIASCSALTKDDGNVIQRPFSAVDASKVIVLEPGRTFQIVLQSNPTTGYGWHLSIDQPNVVKEVAENYIADSSGRVGVGGETTWTLRTHVSGIAKLTFSYGRSWATDSPVTRTVNFSINVR